MQFVFHSRVELAASLSRYYLLVGFIATLSYLLIRGLTEKLGAPVMAAKILVDTLLWLVTFAVQRIFVFAEGNEE
jgi:putative flippase GtrA